MGIIKPRKRKKDPAISGHAIMIMPKRDLRCLIKTFDVRDCGEQNGLYSLYLTKNNTAICGPFLGAPQAVMGLEKLIVLGAKKIWVFSWCGSLKEDLRIGDVFLPRYAISEEGTSQHYPISKEAETDPSMRQKIKDALIQEGLFFVEGTICTTDAPYRETKEKIDEYQRRGAFAIDMEMSALMTVANFRSVSIAGAFVVSDELYSKKWVCGFSSSKLKDTSKRVLNILLKLADKGY